MKSMQTGGEVAIKYLSQRVDLDTNDMQGVLSEAHDRNKSHKLSERTSVVSVRRQR